MTTKTMGTKTNLNKTHSFGSKVDTVDNNFNIDPRQ